LRRRSARICCCKVLKIVEGGPRGREKKKPEDSMYGSCVFGW